MPVSKKKVSKKKASKKVTKKVTKKVQRRKPAPPTNPDGTPYDPDTRVSVKYDNDYHPQAFYKLSLMGLSNAKIAAFFEVSTTTIENWVKKRKDFAKAYRAGKEMADATVAHSLFKRATGMTITEEKVLSDKGVHMETVQIEKEIVPDVKAAIFWLINRQKEHWANKQEVDGVLDLGEELAKLANNLPD